MAEENSLRFVVTNAADLNASYIPFLKNGGLFIPTVKIYSLGETIPIELLLPDKNDPIHIQGKVVWINPKNALHHTMPGIGIEFITADSTTLKAQLEKMLDPAIEVGTHVYGLQWAEKKSTTDDK